MQKNLQKQFSKLLMLVALLFGVNSFGQVNLVQYKFESNLTPEADAIGSPALTYNGAGLTYNAGVTGVALSTGTGNDANGSFVELTISTTGYSSIKVSWAGRTSNATTPGSWVLTGNSGSGYGAALHTQSLNTSFSNTGDIALATAFSNNSSIKLKITASNNTSLRNLRIDDLIIKGTFTGPTVTTTAANAFTTTGATLNGSINPNGTGAVTTNFQYTSTSGSYTGVALTPATPSTAPNGSTTTIALPLTSLAVNTQYFFRAVGTQGTTTITTTNGDEASFYTLANTPGTPTVSSPQLTTLNVAVAANGNPTNTTYVIRVVNGGTTQYVQANGSLGATEVLQTAATWGTKTVTGLTNNTTYTFSVKAKNGAGTDTAYSATTDGTTLANTSPTITTGGTIVTLSTIYGTATATPGQFTVSSLNLTADVVVTAPAGYEFSLAQAGTYTPSVTVPQNTTNTTVYIRLAATAPASTTAYNGNLVTLTSGATTVTKAITNSTVAQKALTISGLTPNAREYDGTNTAPVTGVGVLSATVNGDTVTLTGTPAFNFANANVGTAKPITITGYTLTGANASNYTLTLPTLTGNITAKNLTIANATAQDKVYDGNQIAVATGTLTGVVGTEAVSYTAAFAQASAGNGISINYTLTQPASNYTLTQPTVTANITKATPTFVIQPIAIGVGEERILVNTANEISNSNGALTYSSNDTSKATVTVATLKGIAAGTAILTINQAEGTNYVAATTTVNINVTTITYVSGDYRSLSTGTWITAISGTPVATWERYNNGVWAPATSPTTPPANTTASIYVQSGNSITAGQFASGVKLKISGTFTVTTASTAATVNVNNGGTLNLNAALTIAASTSGGILDVTNGGTLNINYATATATSTLWNGDENFHSGSTVNIQNWSYGASNRVILASSAIKPNDAGYYFGNLTISGAPSSLFTMVAINLPNVKLCENDFTVATTSGNVGLTTTGGGGQITIGGDMILNSGTLLVAASTNGDPATNVLGNVTVNAGTLNMNQNSSGANSTLNIAKNFTIVSPGTLTSGDPTGSKVAFTGNTVQSLSIATTIGSNIAFEIASGAEVQLINQNLNLTNSTNPLTVLTGGTLAFNNFNVTGAGAFTQQADATLKITDIAGVSTGVATTSGNLRNTGGRTYTAGGNFTYVGSTTPQVFGNAVTNAGTITIDKTNTTDVVTATAVSTLGNIVVSKGVLDAGTIVLGGNTTNLTVAADGKYKTAGAGTQPNAGGTYALNAASTVEFYGSAATDIRTTPTYGKVIVSGTNVGTDVATSGLKFATGGAFEVTNGSKFKVAQATGFNGGTATAVTTTGTPAITLGETSTVEYTGTAAQTITAFNTTTGEGTEGYGNLTLKNAGITTLGANLVYVRNDVKLEGTTAALTINTGYTLKVKNQFVTNGNTVLIENNGALLQTNAVANSGEIDVLKNGNPLYRYDYTLWSSPVFGSQKLNQFSPSTVSTRFYDYGVVNNTGYYLNIPNGDVTFTPAKGYLIRMPDVEPQIPGYYTIETPFTFVGNFEGTPNNGNIAIAANTAASRYTAVGNPYPSPISVVDFFTTNSEVINASSGIYFWRKKNGASTSSYATLTLAGYTNAGYHPNPAPGNNSANQAQFFAGNQNDWIISQGQGFFVRTKADLPGTPEIIFNNAMRRPAPVSGNQAFFRTAQSATSRLWLNITNANDEYSQSAIAYIDGTTTGLDYGYDGRQFSDANGISLYSLVNEAKLAIQARPLFENSDVVPMGYVADVAGQLTIALDHTDGVFSNGQDVYLRDNVLGLVHNVTEGAYTFATEAGTFNERFDVVYTADALGTTNPVLNANSVIIYKDGNSLNINAGNSIINGVTVFDIRGRQLLSKTGVNAAQTVLTGLDVAQQVLIIEVTTDHGKVSKKIVY